MLDVFPKKSCGIPVIKHVVHSVHFKTRFHFKIFFIFIQKASIAESLRDAKSYGFDVTNNSFNWLKLKEKRDAYIARLNGIYEKNLSNDKVAYLKGFASLVNGNTVKVQNGDESSEIKAKNILITVGKYIPCIWRKGVVQKRRHQFLTNS